MDALGIIVFSSGLLKLTFYQLSSISDVVSTFLFSVPWVEEVWTNHLSKPRISLWLCLSALWQIVFASAICCRLQSTHWRTWSQRRAIGAWAMNIEIICINIIRSNVIWPFCWLMSCKWPLSSQIEMSFFDVEFPDSKTYWILMGLDGFCI